MKTKNKTRLTFIKSFQQAAENIRDDCRRNVQPDVYYTAYKPLLMERSANYRKNNQTLRNFYQNQRSLTEKKFQMRSSQPLDRSYSPVTPKTIKFKSSHNFSTYLSQSRSNSKSTNQKYFSLGFNQSGSQIKLDGISYFIKKLYFAKTKDLSIHPNAKQQKIFIAKLRQLVNQNQFVTPESDFGLNCVNLIGNFLFNYPVTRLILDRNPIADVGALKIAQIFPTSKISELSLVSINFSPKSASTLISSFVGHPHIQILNLSSSDGLNRNRINSEAYVQMKQVFQNPLCKINSINLANTSMGQSGFLAFCKCFEKYLNLEFKLINLSLNEITISQQNQSTIRSCLMKICVSRLELQNNNFGDIGAKIIAPVFGGKIDKSLINNHLTYLNLSNNNIKSFGFDALCNFLPGNKKITQFYMDDNDLSERQMFYCVKQLLSYTWSIKKLSLRNTLKTTASTSLHLKSMAQGLLRNKSIRELDISYNPINADSFVQIFDHLQQNNTLKILVMQGCQIEDEHLARIQELIKNLRSLSSLNLCNNSISDKGGKTLIKILVATHSLTQLNIKRNCININVLKDIAYELKQNRLIAQTRGDPQFNYINYIMGLHVQQKKNLQKQIQKMDQKEQFKKAKHLAIDVIGKQDQISKRQDQIKAETIKISKMQAQMNNIMKEKQKKKKSYSINYVREDSFLVTN